MSFTPQDRIPLNITTPGATGGPTLSPLRYALFDSVVVEAMGEVVDEFGNMQMAGPEIVAPVDDRAQAILDGFRM